MLFNSVKQILITGGTGSFGKAFLSKILNKFPQLTRVVIYSRDELKQWELKLQYPQSKYPQIRFFLGDVRDKNRLKAALEGIDVVVHAAALKQVPAAEYNPMEFIKTNVIGSDNIVQASLESNVKKVIALSTDKAAAPVNLYGATKLCADKLFIAANNIKGNRDITFSVVRYGNVMGSRGSVIPLFLDQIKQNKDLTVTDPKMTRFLMSLDDSVDLVLHAFENADQGDIFVQKAPASTVQDLALALKELFNSDSDIKIIGTRHGEKLYESLLSREEMSKAEDMKRYYRVPMDGRDLNYNKFFNDGEANVSVADDYTSHNTTRLDVPGIKELLMKLPLIRSELDA